MKVWLVVNLNNLIKNNDVKINRQSKWIFTIDIYVDYFTNQLKNRQNS